MLILIPKGNVNTWGIRMIEVVCKVLEAVIDNWIKSVVQLHNFLHRFCTGRGTGNAIMDLKIVQ